MIFLSQRHQYFDSTVPVIHKLVWCSVLLKWWHSFLPFNFLKDLIYSFLILTALEKKREENAKKLFPSIGSSSPYLSPILLPPYNPQVKMSSLLWIWRLWLVSLPPTSLSGCPSVMSCSSLLTHEVSCLWFSLTLVRLCLNWTNYCHISNITELARVCRGWIISCYPYVIGEFGPKL